MPKQSTKQLPDLWALRDPKTGDYVRYNDVGGEVITYSDEKHEDPKRHCYSKAYKWVRLRPEVER